MPPKRLNPQPPARLGPAEIQQVYACLSVGGTLKDAADYVGVSGDAIRARRRDDPAFARGLRQAVKKGKLHHLNKIGKAAAWQASAWVLERRWRKQFGRNPRPKDADGNLRPDHDEYDFSPLSPADLRQLFALLNKASRSTARPRVIQPKEAITRPRAALPGPAPADGSGGSDDGEGTGEIERSAPDAGPG